MHRSLGRALCGALVLGSGLGGTAFAQATHPSRADNPHGVTKAQVGLDQVQNILDNLVATVDPTATDDSTPAGYAVGSRWVNTSSGAVFTCMDATDGAAVWTQVNAAGGTFSGRTVVVAATPGAGNETANGTALVNAMNGITDASASKRYLLKIEPGEYDLGAGSLVMQPYVDVEGSGPDQTFLIGDGFSAATTGTVVGASNAALRGLRVQARGNSDYAVAFFAGANTVRLSDVELVVDNTSGLQALGVLASGAAEVELRSVQVASTGVGGSFTQGVALLAGGSPVLRMSGSSIDVLSNGGSAYAINAGSLAGLTIRDSRVVTSGSAGAIGVSANLNASARALVQGSRIEATSSAAIAWGVSLQASGEEVLLLGCQVLASGAASTSAAVRNTAGASVRLRVIGSQLESTGSSGYGFLNLVAEQTDNIFRSEFHGSAVSGTSGAINQDPDAGNQDGVGVGATRLEVTGGGTAEVNTEASDTTCFSTPQGDFTNTNGLTACPPN